MIKKKAVQIYFLENNLIIPFIKYFSKKYDFYYFRASNKNFFFPKKKINYLYLISNHNRILYFLKRFFYIPKYLFKIKPQIIIVTDVFHLQFFLVVFYKIFHFNTKVILYSEVKKLPDQSFKKLLSFIYFKLFLKFFFHNFINQFFCFTNMELEFYQKLLPERKKDIFVVPACINKDLFFPPTKRRVYLKNNILNMIIVARFVEYKNYFDLLDALYFLIAKKNFINFRLNILGSGPLKSKINEKINELNLKKFISFLEKTSYDKMKFYYYENDLLLLPSYYEAIGMVVPEAMACGTPTITSDTIGANVYVKEGETGLIFKTGDSIDLANKILEMYNKSKLEKMGKNAYLRIKENFYENSLEKYLLKTKID